MKLETIDPEHPHLYCVATVVERHGFRIRLHLDGVDERYDFWASAHSDTIFPPTWAARNGKKLSVPKGAFFEIIKMEEIIVHGNESARTIAGARLPFIWQRHVANVADMAPLECFSDPRDLVRILIDWHELAKLRIFNVFF